MNALLRTLFFFLFPFVSYGQTGYSGFIDQYPVEFVIDAYSDGVVSGVYAYTRFDEPIPLEGTLKQKTLALRENDASGKTRATLIFENYDPGNSAAEGVWTEFGTNKQLRIRLKREFALTFSEKADGTKEELLQRASLRKHYFRVTVSDARVTAIKILEKKTDKLLRKFAVDCQLSGLDNISIGDYNFDGFDDFSVFEASYAGPNTSSLYFLFDPKTGTYIESSFSGTSLEFDSKTKRIYEHNQCCAGRSHITAEYKVVKNKMVLVKQTCLEYDDATEELKPVPCK